MATLVLGTLGGALGGALGGPIGAMLGKAAGSFLGNSLDHQLFGQSTHQEGPRLSNLDMQASTEGAGVPFVAGRVRLSGQVIWATRFEEVATTTKHASGGKGGPKATSTTYAYYANFAIGLCEGEIASVSRIWADGKLIDQNDFQMRVYSGSQDQAPDPLITAKEGAAPAYRGTAYVVFERLPLETFGNRLPQFTFEIVRPLGGLEEKIRAVTIIPGSTEFGYEPTPVLRTEGEGVTAPENTHDFSAPTDWVAAMDQLQALCPNLERVALVVAWFGTSLNAAECQIEPRVEFNEKETSIDWVAGGVARADATLVSHYNGRPAYGGSPSDSSIIAAIGDLKARGLKVTLLPFIMMDVVPNNTLGDPWSDSPSQPAYPWRGMVTVSPAPGRPGSPDATPGAAAALSNFVGSASPADFSVSGQSVSYQGLSEWSLRRFLLHLAYLGQVAGGVDAFLLCSELRGLTKVRDARASYPFVDHLVAIAQDVRQIVGPGTILTYGADWSEYSNHAPADGSGDLTFHLDPLWASPNIDVVGIDQYQPITDWRYTAGHIDTALGASPYDPAVIEAGLVGGENFDWYYASQTDRDAQIRSPITDSDYNEPWVWRSKDFISWWSMPHHNRVGGVRETSPTAWVPQSKPYWLTEFGAGAVDLAGNQPSSFPSDKPDNDTKPHYSKGARDDYAQRAILETALDYWAQPGSVGNPVSAVDGRAMIDPSATHLWTWDARPYPAFPYATQVWTDGVNWSRGHWLTGRLGAVSLRALLLAMADYFELPPLDASRIYGVVEGYKLLEPTKARGIFDDLARVYGFDLVPTPNGATAAMRTYGTGQKVQIEDVVALDDAPLISVARVETQTIARQTTLGFLSMVHDYRPGVMRSARRDGVGGPDAFHALPLTLDPDKAGQIVERMQQETEVGAQTVGFTLPASQWSLGPGDIVDLVVPGASQPLRVCLDRIIEGSQRRAEAHCVDGALYGVESGAYTSTHVAPTQVRKTFGAPDVLVLDLPAPVGKPDRHNARIAAFAKPWPGSIDVYAGTEATGFEPVQNIQTPAITGVLAEPLAAGPTAIIHHGANLIVDVPTGALETITHEALLAGGNLAAIQSDNGLEVIQFGKAELVEPGRYLLSALVRGRGGTEAQARITTPKGARFVRLDSAVVPLELDQDNLAQRLTLRAEPRGGGLGELSRIDKVLAVAPRSLQPLAPVHLRVMKSQTGDLTVSWVRRTRAASDDWSLATIALNEESEAYQVEVWCDGLMKRQTQSANPNWTYTLAQQTTDALIGATEISVRQVGTAGRLGFASTLTL